MTGFNSKREMAADKQEPKAFNFLTMTDKELIETASKQVQALRMALDMIECEKYERRHVRWAIVDALKEAALAQPAQKPVGRFAKFTDGIWREVTDGSAGQPLYTAPPQREWVGLTDEEIRDCLGPEAVRIPPGWSKLTRAIEAKLKEKNNGT